MDFHIITSNGGMHLFSTHNGRLVDAQSDTMDARSVEPTETVRKSVTTEVLQEIEKTNSDPKIHALLLEISRLRSVVLYADQLQRMLTTLPGPQGSILDKLREKLKEEQCMDEPSRLAQGSSG
jgi:hypothetical protein